MTKTTGKLRRAPPSPITADRLPCIFKPSDVAAISEYVKRPLGGPGDMMEHVRAYCGANMIDSLNIAARRYFVVARRERAGTPGDFANWCEGLAKASEAFLNALGIDATESYATLPTASFVALCSRPGRLTVGRYPEGFDHMVGLQAAAQGALLTVDLARQAANYHRGRSKRGRPSGNLSARQELVALLASVYTAAFVDPAPGYPRALQSPFLRFAEKVCRLIAARPPMDAVTLPDDQRDHEAVRELRQVSEDKLADDQRRITERRAAAARARAERKAIGLPENIISF